MDGLNKTPMCAQGVARTLMQLNLLNATQLGQINQNVASNSRLSQWLAQCLYTVEMSADKLAQQLARAWQVRRVSPNEWATYRQTVPTESTILPKSLADAPQGVVALGSLGTGMPKLGILDGSDAQILQGLAFVFRESFEWRLLSLDEYESITTTQRSPDYSASNPTTSFSPQHRRVGRGEHSDAEDAPVVRYLQDLLLRLVDERASDVHFEPFDRDFRVRARVDGVLREVARPDTTLKEAMTVRLKIMAQMDIAEKRLPQDGRMKLTNGGNKTVDCRVSSLPTVFGEKIVVRFLNNSETALQLDTLGFEEQQLHLVESTLTHPHGMILMTGPTGSGKTVSLYACMNRLNHDKVNISTVEDPVEIFLHGVNQVSINERAGVGFANILRAFLRQDPDILMVGEIRDLETADISVKAAQTGHLVLSTLHTNDATMALTRLMQMGVTPYNVAASVRLIIAQRLVRKLCGCKQAIRIEPTLLHSAGMDAIQAQQKDWTAYAPKGCRQCHNSGYIGRTGIFQVVAVTGEMQNLVAANASAQVLAQAAAQAGHLSLREAGLRKLRAGISSLEEVTAVTL